MPKFSARSASRLLTCHPDLQRVCNEVIKSFDFSVLEGHRSVDRQRELFRQGKSQLDGTNKKSKHNFMPSRAVDIAPYPINWEDRERFTYLAGYMMATARHMGISLRWGGDWDLDTEVLDNAFDDLGHFELL